MSLRIGFDLDGTLADMQSALRREAEALFGPAEVVEAPAPDAVAESRPGSEPSSSETAESTNEDDDDTGGMRLSRADTDRLWEHVKTLDNFWVGLAEMEPGVVARLASEAVTRRWEVIFLTTRPSVAGDTVQIQTQRWLEAQGFRLPSVFVVPHSRGKIADALSLDAFVDDRPENCLDIALDSKATSILIWPEEHGRKVPLGLDRLTVRVVPSIGKALDLLIGMDDRRRIPTLLRAVKHLFGGRTRG